ncbi:AbrB/MazE/SpoVT family DNA-binding domain-containing protein [Candidatus Curtissbacteria bacterium]|nr:AbrB/MazE/SpoVT family DNA-binding domain-containing protein [Candidatus Curtissbacteria bacterium]
MSDYTTITPKFQVHIPVSIRKKIGLKHGKAIIRSEKRKIIIEPIDEKKGILSLAGKFKVKKPIPAEKIRDHIDYSWGKW